MMDTIKKEYKEACLNLRAWQFGGSNFTSLLYTLINKADPVNRAKIRRSYPVEVTVYEDWQKSPDEKDFFKKHLKGMDG